MPKNKSNRSGNTKTRFHPKDEDDDTQDSETLNHVQVKSIPTLNDSKKQTKKQFNASPSNHGSTLSKSHHDDHDDDDTLKSEIDMIHTSSTTPVLHEEEEEQEIIKQQHTTVVLSLLQQTPYFIHGSQDSLDVDKIYMFTARTMPSNHKECCLMCFGSNTNTLDENHSTSTMKREGPMDDGHSVNNNSDVNLFEIMDDQTPSYVRRVFRGLPDEVNNGLFKTLELHSQTFDHIQPIRGMVKRMIPLKCVMTLQNILVKIRRCEEVRNESILALKSFDVTSRMQMLKNLDFTKIVKHLKTEDLKYFAFRLSQTVALVEGLELYTKKEIVEYDKNLKNVIYRFEGVEHIEDEKLRTAVLLNEYLKKLLQYMEGVKSTKMKNFEILSVKKNCRNDNLFLRQCHGCVIKQQMYCCEVLHYPRDYLGDSTEQDERAMNDSIHMFVDFDTDELYIFDDTLENSKIVKSVTSLVKGNNANDNSKKSKHVSVLSYSSVKDHTLKGLDFSKYFYVFRFDSKAKQLSVEFMRERCTNETRDTLLNDNWKLK